MPNCRDMDSRLVDFIYDELPAGEREEVERHLRECPACRTESESLSAIRRIMGRLREVEAPSLGEDVLKAAAAPVRLRPARKPWRQVISHPAFASAAIAASVLAMVGTYLLKDLSKAPRFTVTGEERAASVKMQPSLPLPAVTPEQPAEGGEREIAAGPKLEALQAEKGLGGPSRAAESARDGQPGRSESLQTAEKQQLKKEIAGLDELDRDMEPSLHALRGNEPQEEPPVQSPPPPRRVVVKRKGLVKKPPAETKSLEVAAPDDLLGFAEGGGGKEMADKKAKEPARLQMAPSAPQPRTAAAPPAVAMKEESGEISAPAASMPPAQPAPEADFFGSGKVAGTGGAAADAKPAPAKKAVSPVDEAEAFTAQGKCREAFEAVEKAEGRRESGNFAEAYMKCAACFEKSGDSEAALTVYDKVAGKFPAAAAEARNKKARLQKKESIPAAAPADER